MYFTCCWMTSEYRQLSIKDAHRGTGTGCSIERRLSYREWNNLTVHSPPPPPPTPPTTVVSFCQKLSRVSGARMTGVCYKRGHCSNKKQMTHPYSSLSLLLLLVSLRNKTAGRRRQNTCVWQKWQGYYLRVLSWSLLNANVFWSFTKKLCLKESEV